MFLFMKALADFSKKNHIVYIFQQHSSVVKKIRGLRGLRRGKLARLQFGLVTAF